MSETAENYRGSHLIGCKKILSMQADRLREQIEKLLESDAEIVCRQALKYMREQLKEDEDSVIEVTGWAPLDAKMDNIYTSQSEFDRSLGVVSVVMKHQLSVAKFLDEIG